MPPHEHFNIENHLPQESEQQGNGKLSDVENQLKRPASSSRIDASAASPTPYRQSFCGKGVAYWVLMTFSVLFSLVGGSSAALLGRLYFVHGGSHLWLYTWIQSVAWPILLVPLLLSYWRHSVGRTRLTAKLLVVYSVLGCLLAFDNLLYSWGLSYLPVSTSSLLFSSQLAFNVVFSYLLVKQRITPYVLNSVVIITIGAVLLGVHGTSDRPAGTTQRQYIIGFVVTIAASALYALILPLMELAYRKLHGKTNFIAVLELQIGTSIAATVFAMVGMWIDGSFSAMPREVSRFDLGSMAYYLTLILSAIGWQLFFLGTAGIVFLSSALMSCVFVTATIPVVPILAVIFFHDSFTALKGISMLLSIWGFTSYIYGGYVASKSRKNLEPEA